MVLTVPADAPQPAANKRRRLEDGNEERGEQDDDDEVVDAILPYHPWHGPMFAALEVSDGPRPCTIECTFEVRSNVAFSRLGQGLGQELGQGPSSRGQGLAAEDRSKLFDDCRFDPFVHQYTERKEQRGVQESIVDPDKYQQRLEGHYLSPPTLPRPSLPSPYQQHPPYPLLSLHRSQYLQSITLLLSSFLPPSSPLSPSLSSPI